MRPSEGGGDASGRAGIAEGKAGSASGAWRRSSLR